MTIGEKIKAMREQKQMSQEELALKVGKAGRTYIYRIENGLKNPSFPIKNFSISTSSFANDFTTRIPDKLSSI